MLPPEGGSAQAHTHFSIKRLKLATCNMQPKTNLFVLEVIDEPGEAETCALH